MKKLTFALLGMILSASLFCQAPNSFNYQAVLRNSDGSVKSSESVAIQIEILQGTIDGSTVYLENHSANTNSFGLVNLIIGDGTTSYNIGDIDWSDGLFFIRISVDGVEIGTNQLLSVPYSLYAAKAGNTFSGDYSDLSNIPGQFNPETHLHSEADISDLSHYTDEDIDGNETAFAAWDKDASDDFDGQYTSLTGAPVNVSELNNDAGYLSSFVEVDGDISNEIQDLELAGNILTITRNGTATPIDLSAYLDNTDTQLTESEVDAYVANNGYLTGETDGSITNEIQDLQLSGNLLTITNNGTATIIDLTKYLDDTDTQLTEAEVDGYIANNGYLTDVIGVPIYTSGITNTGNINNSRRIITDSLQAHSIEVASRIYTSMLIASNIDNNGEIITNTLRSNDIEVAGRVNTSDLSSNNINTGSLDAGWIGTGGLDVFGRIMANELEVNGWTNFNDLNVNNSITTRDLYVGGIADLGNQRIINLADPTTDQHAATKRYVDISVAPLLETEVDPLYASSPASVIVDEGSGQVITAAERSKLQNLTEGAEINVQSDWNEANNAEDSFIWNKPALAAVATTGDYDDLTDLPVTDGSETKVNAGANISVSGTGTSADPYTISSSGGGGVGTHFPGELYGGGVVFFTWANGQHGFIVSLNNISGSTTWSNATTLCGNYANDGFDDWFLPSTDIQKLLFNHSYFVNNTLDNDGDPSTLGFEHNTTYYYWASNNIGGINPVVCRYQNSYIVNFFFASMTNSYACRAVREF